MLRIRIGDHLTVVAGTETLQPYRDRGCTVATNGAENMPTFMGANNLKPYWYAGSKVPSAHFPTIARVKNLEPYCDSYLTTSTKVPLKGVAITDTLAISTGILEKIERAGLNHRSVKKPAPHFCSDVSKT